MKTYKGKFKPKNPSKYKGDPTNIIYRSFWECKYMMSLDADKDVISWSSEEVIVPYKSPVDGLIHRYYPDFVITKKNKIGQTQTFMIEIKPLAQTKPPKKQQKLTPRYINEVKTWGVNDAKWMYAREYCVKRNWIFVILSEKELGISF